MNERILQIRSLIGDPAATSVNYEDPLPASALEGAAYTTGDGAYQMYRAGAWKPVKIQMDDSEIERLDSGGSVYSAALNAINVLLLKINPLDYITSGGAGAQSVGFPSLADVTAFFNAKKAAVASLAARAGDAQRAGRRPVPVGGVFDWERPQC
jgi:hypothetical protein